MDSQTSVKTAPKWSPQEEAILIEVAKKYPEDAGALHEAFCKASGVNRTASSLTNVLHRLSCKEKKLPKAPYRAMKNAEAAIRREQAKKDGKKRNGASVRAKGKATWVMPREAAAQAGYGTSYIEQLRRKKKVRRANSKVALEDVLLWAKDRRGPRPGSHVGNGNDPRNGHGNGHIDAVDLSKNDQFDSLRMVESKPKRKNGKHQPDIRLRMKWVFKGIDIGSIEPGDALALLRRIAYEDVR